MHKPSLVFSIKDPQNFALLVETHVHYVQFWHIGITRSLKYKFKDQSTFEPYFNIGADMVNILL